MSQDFTSKVSSDLACVGVQRRAFVADQEPLGGIDRKESDMAAAKKRKSKKAAKKATSKTHGREKQPKVSKSKAKVTAAQIAAGKPQSDSQNPFRAGGSYWSSVEALKVLGIGKMHPFSKIVPAVKRVMGEHWKTFAEKDARNEKTGKDADHRILQNVSVLSRQDYGKPLRELGYEVRWDGREKLAGVFKLGNA
jgi:hypothetical protein